MACKGLVIWAMLRGRKTSSNSNKLCKATKIVGLSVNYLIQDQLDEE